MLEMLSSGGGLAVHPGIVSFVNGVHPHLDAERCEYDVAIRRARSSNILSYYDFERFVVEFLKSNGYFIHGFEHLVAIIKSLQDFEFFRTFIVFPDSTCAAIHGVEVSDNYIRMLLLRNGFLWSIIFDHYNSHISHEVRLNSIDDDWSEAFIHDWVIPSYITRR